jgi:hypothetical protein
MKAKLRQAIAKVYEQKTFEGIRQWCEAWKAMPYEAKNEHVESLNTPFESKSHNAWLTLTPL